MEATHDTPVMARIRKALKALAPNELAYISNLQVARDANKRAYVFVIKGRRMDIDTAVQYIVGQKYTQYNIEEQETE